MFSVLYLLVIFHRLQELKDNFAPSKILFAVYKVQGVDDRENVVAIRDKLISIAWVGPSVSPLARNAVLASKPARTNLFQGCTTEFQIDDADRVRNFEHSPVPVAVTLHVSLGHSSSPSPLPLIISPPSLLLQLTEREISRELLRSGGAHKPTYYKFADSKVNVSDLD